MPNANKPLLESKVHPNWIDYNGHMYDASYAHVFSLAVDRLMTTIGIDHDFREKHQYTIYTLETHLRYLKEAYNGQEIHVTVQLLDHDTKRLHVFFVMKNKEGERLATSEQMLMGINMKERRSAPFPESIVHSIIELAKAHEGAPIPDEAGQKIGIRRMKE
ncbi:thioesterase family protein [Salicibibacter cibarius]|uniref:Thioesterase family protein n=1 Tax=Salicibibacter cibarius TaxID=2743000 RepID=A0A7T6Z3W9_9BACI|nr:thioesterase family protein [Salicibibacter cibarius]QQK76558.1 thioesterase family protein [Salicibibacter cibarius]